LSITRSAERSTEPRASTSAIPANKASEEIIEVQYENGDIEEIDLDTWHELDLERAEEPEGWASDDEDEDEEEDDEDLDEDDWDEDEDDDDWDDDDEDLDDDDDYSDRDDA
jgi:hypothetical protein